MADKLTARQFQRAEGTRDWRALGHGAVAVFRTRTLAAGAGFVERIGALADIANHHPDVDLRPQAVAVRLLSHDVQGLSARDADLARRISTWARELDLMPDPAAAQDVELAIDALDIPAVRPFWAAVLGHDPVGDEDVVDPHGRLPGIWFQQMDAPRPLRNRLHLDVFVPHDERATRVEAALGAGGHVANDAFAPQWWTLADPEGNEADVEAWEGAETLPEPWLTPDAFRAADGVEDWRFLQGASAYYPTDGLARGVELASAVADPGVVPPAADPGVVPSPPAGAATEPACGEPSAGGASSGVPGPVFSVVLGGSGSVLTACSSRDRDSGARAPTRRRAPGRSRQED